LDGTTEGYTDGLLLGHIDGTSDGLTEGYIDGLLLGCIDGITEGMTDGRRKSVA